MKNDSFFHNLLKIQFPKLPKIQFPKLPEIQFPEKYNFTKFPIFQSTKIHVLPRFHQNVPKIKSKKEKKPTTHCVSAAVSL